MVRPSNGSVTGKIDMADYGTPHFHNDPGLEKVRIGAREFMCVGARPPYDHPHIFIDMGSGNEAICPYCSTLYIFDPKLGHYEAEPAECAYSVTAVAEDA